jgi:hypothetical protein
MSFQALVVRLDAEIEGKLGLQRQLSALENKVRHLESALQVHSAPRECQPHNVESSVGVKVADFEEERRMFDEARKVRIPILIQLVILYPGLGRSRFSFAPSFAPFVTLTVKCHFRPWSRDWTPKSKGSWDCNDSSLHLRTK